MHNQWNKIKIKTKREKKAAFMVIISLAFASSSFLLFWGQ